ncbi:enolase C-terminal domain-like protein [Flavobacterium channae]|uniref:enolase C-terminal domain-like protein n=1 Tax=Flavobacterium channae TaxID=2897181 RepID=UPI001E352DD5|nr:enolase C-terminal domain-like protein [Flavobacterium channae]UGS22632.1 chloromuconate cycloisomerase [Flavobacterium channae]
MQITWQIVRLQLKETFSISYGNYSFREALIISLSKNGKVGYGECTAIDYYGINLNDFTQKLVEIQTQIEKQSINHPFEFYTFLESLQLHSFLRSALDCAFWDLFGKLENKSFLELNSIEVKQLPESSITISVAPIEEQLQKNAKSDWNKFKVKWNHYNEKALDLLLNCGKEIALDANGSFSVSECQQLEENPLSAQFTYIEQPMKTGISNYSHLSANKYANWMADEDCQEKTKLSDLKSHYKTINIKLVKTGGLTPALQLINEARANDFKIMIGCMTESTVGISAGAVLVPLVDYVDLDGANLIANDIAFGSVIEKGKVVLSDKVGLGISLK